MKLYDELAEYRKVKEKLESDIEGAKVKMRKYLLKMTKAEMKAEFREYKTDILEDLCVEIGALEHEEYEICQAIREVLEERSNDSN